MFLFEIRPKHLDSVTKLIILENLSLPIVQFRCACNIPWVVHFQDEKRGCQNSAGIRSGTSWSRDKKLSEVFFFTFSLENFTLIAYYTGFEHTFSQKRSWDDDFFDFARLLTVFCHGSQLVLMRYNRREKSNRFNFEDERPIVESLLLALYQERKNQETFDPVARPSPFKLPV